MGDFVDEFLLECEEAGVLRRLTSTVRKDGCCVKRGGRRLLSFSCNDYLGLSVDDRLKKAAIGAVEEFGVGGGASRFISGNNPLFEELEEKLARVKGAEAALVFGSGYLANIGVIPALVGRNDLVVADRLVHASLLDGIKLSGAKLLRFVHNDLESCERLLKKHRGDYERCLVVTETVFSMDGDVAPVDSLRCLADEYDAWLVTDDAHGFGVLPFNDDKEKRPYIQLGTLSKAVGCYGGYVCADRKIIDFLKNKCRSLIYSTALPPMVVAAASAAVDIISSDKELCAKPLANAQYFTSMMGLNEAESAIVVLVLGDVDRAVRAAALLEERGFFVSAIRPPTVPVGSSRLRFTFSAVHERADIEALVGVIKEQGLM